MTRTMRSILFGAGLAALLAGAAVPEAGAAYGPGGNPNGRPTRGRSSLAPPEGAADTDAVGVCRVKFFPANARRAERSWFRLQVRKLDASTTYSLWADDPSTPEDATLVQFDTLATNEDGVANYRKDTKKGGTMPFGATLADLGGKAIEVRDEGGTTTVLAGSIPAVQ